MSKRHIPALVALAVAAVACAIVFSLDRGKKTEKETLVPIEEKVLSKIAVEWDPGRDAEYEKQDAKSKGNSAPSESSASESAPASESQPAAGRAEPKFPKRTVMRKVSAGEEDHWEFDEPSSGARLDPSDADNLVKRLSFLKCDRYVEFEKGEVPDPVEFGLDRPMLRVTVYRGESKSYTLSVGKKAPTSTTERYAQVAGERKVAVVPDSLVTDLTKDPAEIRDKRLFTLQSDEVKTVQVGRIATAETGTESSPPPPPLPSDLDEPGAPKPGKAAKDSFSVERQEAVSADESAKWVLTSPSKSQADSNTCRNLASSLATKKADRIVVEKPTDQDLALHGLDTPTQTYTMIGRKKHKDTKKDYRSDTTETLSIGSKDPDGNYFARVSWKPEIYLLKSTDWSDFQKSLDDVRSKALHEIDRDNVASVETVRGGYSAKLVPDKKKKGKWVLASGEETKEFAATSLVNSLVPLDATKFVTDQPADLAKYGLDAPVATATVAPKHGKPVVLYFGSEAPDDPGLVYAKQARSDSIFLVGSYKLTAIPQRLDDIAVVKKPEPKPPTESTPPN